MCCCCSDNIKFFYKWINTNKILNDCGVKNIYVNKSLTISDICVNKISYLKSTDFSKNSFISVW